MLKIAVIEGTVRKGRWSIHAAKLVAEVGKTFEDVEITFVDPAELHFPLDGSAEETKDPKYSQIVKDSDAFFIVTPEYNHGYPGSLKRMLDSEFGSYKHKPVALAGVSDGPWGGVRVIEALLPVLRTLSLVVLKSDVHFPKVNEIFDETGKLLKPEYTEYIKQTYTELIWMAKVLKYGRENVK